MLDFGESYSRRLPIYILIDCSESMIGDPLTAVNAGLQQLCTDLRNDPKALETAWLSVITFAGKAQQITPLTDILKFTPPALHVGPGTGLGAAFDLLGKCLARDLRKNTSSQKGDWKPIIFLLTDGIPTDKWQEGVNRFKASFPPTSINIIAVGCGEDVDLSILKFITPNVLHAKTFSPGDFKSFFNWVSASISTASISAGQEGQGLQLPPAPAQFGMVESATSAAPSHTPTQVILAARCRDRKQGYLMRYRRTSPTSDEYQAERAYPVGNDYFAEAATTPLGQVLDSSKLKGAPPCPYCGRPGWTLAKDKSGLECNDRLTLGSNRAQVMFVLDITGSMAGEINGVKDNIKDFTDYIQAEGLSVEVGLIAFRDLEEREPPAVLKFVGQPFTTNAADFKAQVSRISANGGGSNPGESSFDALALACQQPFREDVTRILILITDEPPLLPDGKIRTVNDVIKALQQAAIDQLHIVIPEHLHPHYAPLHGHIKGQIFPLGKGGRGGMAFRQILLDIGKSISIATRLG